MDLFKSLMSFVLSWCYWFVVGANTLWTVQAWHRCFPTSVFLRKTARQTQNTTCDEQLPLHSHVLPKSQAHGFWKSLRKSRANGASSTRSPLANRWMVCTASGSKDKDRQRWIKMIKRHKNFTKQKLNSNKKISSKKTFKQKQTKKSLRKRHLSFLTYLLIFSQLLSFCHLNLNLSFNSLLPPGVRRCWPFRRSKAAWPAALAALGRHPLRGPPSGPEVGVRSTKTSIFDS